MGKVASSTIYNSLRNNRNSLTLQFHRMPGENRSKINQRNGIRFRILSVLQDMTGSTAQRLLTKYPERCKIVTLVRDPVNRNISGYFQNLWMEQSKQNGQTLTAITKLMRENFLKNYEHRTPLDWFDDEFKPNTNVDVYSYGFDPEIKYKRIKTPDRDILILRTDINDKTKEYAIRKFVNDPSFHLTKANVGEQKKYSQLYKNFKLGLNLPERYLDSMLESRYTRHFYSLDEIAKMNEEYTKGGQQRNPKKAIK